MIWAEMSHDEKIMALKGLPPGISMVEAACQLGATSKNVIIGFRSRNRNLFPATKNPARPLVEKCHRLPVADGEKRMRRTSKREKLVFRDTIDAEQAAPMRGKPERTNDATRYPVREPIDASKAVHLSQAEPHQCRWPLWENDAPYPEKLVCGLRVDADPLSPTTACYCAVHGKIAAPTYVRGRRAATDARHRHFSKRNGR